MGRLPGDTHGGRPLTGHGRGRPSVASVCTAISETAQLVGTNLDCPDGPRLDGLAVQQDRDRLPQRIAVVCTWTGPFPAAAVPRGEARASGPPAGSTARRPPGAGPRRPPRDPSANAQTQPACPGPPLLHGGPAPLHGSGMNPNQCRTRCGFTAPILILRRWQALHEGHRAAAKSRRACSCAGWRCPTATPLPPSRCPSFRSASVSGECRRCARCRRCGCRSALPRSRRADATRQVAKPVRRIRSGGCCTMVRSTRHARHPGRGVRPPPRSICRMTSSRSPARASAETPCVRSAPRRAPRAVGIPEFGIDIGSPQGV